MALSEAEFPGFATLDMIRVAALRNLAPSISDFLEGGAGAEVTLQRNREAFAEILFNPRVMSGASYPDVSTTVLGYQLSMPVLSAPIGVDGLLHPDGHRITALVNQEFGIANVVPEGGTYSLEDLAALAPDAALFGHVSTAGDEEHVIALIRRYEAAGYKSLLVSVDYPVVGWRQRNFQNNFTISPELRMGNFPANASAAADKSWGCGFFREIRFGRGINSAQL